MQCGSGRAFLERPRQRAELKGCARFYAFVYFMSVAPCEMERGRYVEGGESSSTKEDEGSSVECVHVCVVCWCVCVCMCVYVCDSKGK